MLMANCPNQKNANYVCQLPFRANDTLTVNLCIKQDDGTIKKSKVIYDKCDKGIKCEIDDKTKSEIRENIKNELKKDLKCEIDDKTKNEMKDKIKKEIKDEIDCKCDKDGKGKDDKVTDDKDKDDKITDGKGKDDKITDDKGKDDKVTDDKDGNVTDKQKGLYTSDLLKEFFPEM